MRTIDADALKELFREVIGHIAKKPEMNGNLEHMIRASAMVIQMIDDAPTVHPDTTTHDSISAKTGKNDGDRTSGDCISRQMAYLALVEKGQASKRYKLGETWELNGEEIREVLDTLPSAQPERKDALEKAVAVEAISDVLMSRFDISATYAYEVAESAVNRIEVMAKEMGKR